MKKTIILIVALLIAVFVVAGLYFSRLEESQVEVREDLAAIPADATLLLSFRNDSSLYDLFHEYRGFEMILGKKEFAELRTLKEVFSDRPGLKAFVSNQPVYISFHPEEGKVALLISIPFSEAIEPQQAAAAMDSVMQVNALDDAKGIYELVIQGIDRPLFGNLQRGRLSLSFSRALLERSMDDSAPRLSELFLEQFQENSGQNDSPVQLYINHEPLADFISLFARNGTSAGDLFGKLDGLSLMGINYRSDALMFSGSSIISLTDSAYLTLFLEQEPVQHQLKNWIPENVAEVSSYGISDYSKFRTRLAALFENRQESGQLAEQIRYIESNSELNINDEFLPIWGSEFARLRMESGEEVAVAAVRDSLEYAEVVDKISTVSPDSSYRRFDNSNLLYYALGDPMREFKRPYFTYSRGYVIIANTVGALSTYMDRIEAGDLLVDNDDYQEYDRLHSSSSNYSLFIHQENSGRLISRNLKEELRKNFNDRNNFGYQDFYAFTLQLSGNGDRFSVNLYGKFRSESGSQDNETDTE